MRKIVLCILVAFSVQMAANAQRSSKIGKIALVVTWQNESGLWRAVGKIQHVTLAYKTEEEVIGYACSKPKSALVLVATISKYYIYAEYSRIEHQGHVDAREFLAEQGIIFDYNDRVMQIDRELAAREASQQNVSSAGNGTTGQGSNRQSDRTQSSVQNSASNRTTSSASSMAALQAAQERERQGLATRLAEFERQRLQQAEHQRQLNQQQWQQEQTRQQQEIREKAAHDAAVTAYYAQKKQELYDKGAQDLAAIAMEAVNYFSAQKQASEENLARYNEKVRLEEEAEKIRLAEEQRHREEMAALEAAKRESERNFRVSTVTALFDAVRGGAIPTSSSKIEGKQLFYYAFSYNPAEIGDEAMGVYLSNVFEIDRFTDGSWPYHSDILSELSQRAPYQVHLDGYFLSRQAAEQAMKVFVASLTASTVRIIPFQYEGKIVASAQQSDDEFWGTSVKSSTPAKSKTEVSKSTNNSDDFWGMPVKK